jgi:hypothetical protein
MGRAMAKVVVAVGVRWACGGGGSRGLCFLVACRLVWWWVRVRFLVVSPVFSGTVC